MRQTLKIIGLFALLFLALPLVSAVDINSNIQACYNLNDNNANTTVVDGVANYTGTASVNTDTISATGLIDEAFDLDGTGSEYFTAATALGNFGSGDFSVSFWTKKGASAFQNGNIIHQYDAGTGQGFYVKTDDSAGTIKFAVFADAVKTLTSSGNVLTNGSWSHVVAIRDSGTMRLYIDTASQGTTASAGGDMDSTNDVYIGEQSHTPGLAYRGFLDEIIFYDRALNTTEISALYQNGVNGTACPYSAPAPATPTASEALPQTSYAEQSTNVSINNVNYVAVLSNSVTLDDDANLFATATIPIYEPAASNTADCRVTFNGTELTNSETSRTLTTGAAANILIHSNVVNYPAGTYDLELQCKRTGGGAYTISGANIVLHQLTTTGGLAIGYNETNQTSVSIAGVPTSTSLLMSANQTAAGLTRALVASYTTAIDYTATQNVTLTLEVAGYNCTSLTRYGANGALGSVGDSCYYTVLTNETSYDVKLHGSGSGTLEGLSLVAREVILHTAEINNASLSSLSIDNSTYQELASYNITVNGGHSTPNLLTQAALVFQGDNDSATGTFYMTDGTSNSTFVSRTSGNSEPGVLGIQLLSESVTGVVTLTLLGQCDTQNCSLQGTQAVSYLTDDNPATPNTFNVSVKNQYTDVYENNFDVKINDVTYTTSNGVVEVATAESLVNVTFPGTNTTTPVYFSNNTQNHDTSINLTLNATPWTAVYAKEPDLDTVNNFTINWIDLNNTAHNGSYTTTNGVAYVPVFNSTWQLNITNAVGEDGTNYAIDTYEFNTTAYLQNYTFNVLVSNSVNITFYDEETEIIIDFTNVTLEYFSDGGTSGNVTTSTGIMFVNLLLPETYTFIYDAAGYDERFYEFTLINETFNNLNLTLLNSSSSSTVTITVKDTLDNLLENAVVKILKFDVADNEYDLIEVRRTNFEGQTIASLVLNSPLYKFIVEYDDRVVLTTTGTQIYGTDLTLLVNLVDSTGFEEVFTSYSMSGSVTFSNTTNLFTFEYNDESNTGQQACLNIYRVTETRTLYNQTCSSTTSGTLTAWVNNVSGRTYQGVGVITDSNSFDYVIDSEWAVFKERLSDDGSSLIMMIIMIVLFATALAVSVEIAIVTAFTVPLIFTATGLTALSYGVTVPLMVVGVIIAFILGVVRK